MELARIVSRFDIPGNFLSAVPHGSGHINDTYLVETEQGGRRVRYILQRINRRVFRNPAAFMGNIERVLSHLQKKMSDVPPLETARRVLSLVPSRAGDGFCQDEEGEVWRAYRHIEGARSFDVAQSPRQAYEAARAFGAFQRMLMDLPPPPLLETLPNFHDTPHRFQALERAVESDSRNRASEAKAEIEFCLSRRSLSGSLTRLKSLGALTERTIHNDTKLNNVLLDETTGEGLCVIDLDTVMPGLGVWDFGDLVRSAANPAPEDERDLRRVEVDVNLFESITRGWLEALSGALAASERAALVTGAMVITLECGVRFLTDFLEGDRYFRTNRPGQNVDRCRVQFALLRSMEKHEETLERIIRSCETGSNPDLHSS
ncbi:MAG: aminoglycoside phosphotransferase family protein [Acidobacteria bacterium]|nr:aminoglycoside phosphotransferase family protein [Acidobacteriota bacterium]